MKRERNKKAGSGDPAFTKGLCNNNPSGPVACDQRLRIESIIHGLTRRDRAGLNVCTCFNVACAPSGIRGVILRGLSRRGSKGAEGKHAQGEGSGGSVDCVHLYYLFFAA
ncbi:hypothetical protein SMZ33_000172 [Cronobacter turicensis]|nr:hypothetical protein [Cronobacter turicensis]EKM0532267.1 hypothetical protein [Cronobacter turicensis]EKM5761385.1 hypothetical protein [Cronobacter turicensis]ELY4299628.1 hypothetical protein [Cronobacter turicensis]